MRRATIEARQGREWSMDEWTTFTVIDATALNGLVGRDRDSDQRVDSTGKGQRPRRPGPEVARATPLRWGAGQLIFYVVFYVAIEKRIIFVSTVARCCPIVCVCV